MTAGQGDGLDKLLLERLGPLGSSVLDLSVLGGLPVLEACLPSPFRVVFTTRLGGQSRGRFASLNLDKRSGDEPAAVEANRALVARAVGRRLVTPNQVHGVRVVGLAEYVAEGEETPCDGLTLHPEIDKGLAACLLFADCLPVVLCGDADLAVVHVGWRGLLEGAIQQAARCMMSAPGSAVIGPSIGPCCFMVEEEIADAFARRFGSQTVADRPAAKSDGQPEGQGWKVDLWAAAGRALEEVGVSPVRVVNPRLCTACHSDLFFSYRREGPSTGRHACLAWTEDRRVITQVLPGHGKA